MEFYILAFKKYFNFKDSATRAEYWYFTLINIFIIILLSIGNEVSGIFGLELEIALLSSIYVLLMFIPSLSISVRRLHDIGKNGWWILISFVPFLGLILIYWFTLKSNVIGNMNQEIKEK